MQLSEIKLRWRALIHRRRFEQEVDDELAFHLEMRREKLSDGGMPAEQARDAARTDFGNPTRMGETLREMRGWGWIERLWRDVRFALRQLRLNPGFTVGAVLPLALSIGCAAAILTLVDAVLFRPMGIRDPGSVAAVYPVSKANGRYLSNSYPDFRDVASLTGVVDSAAAYLRYPLNVRFAAAAESMNAELVTGEYFRAAGITPALGRALTPDDDLPGAAPVALASYALWENRFQRSASILGSNVWMNGVAFTIVGVMPRGYQGMLLDWYADPSFWAPLTHFERLTGSSGLANWQNRREVQMLMMLARLKPGWSVQQFQAALDVVEARVPTPLNYRLAALPSAQARFFPAYREATVRFLWLLLAVSIAAVAIACFNLANLLLARAAARRHEMATRAAVGASRARLMQQLIVEHAALAACACAVSVPIAMGVTEWLRSVQFTYIFQPTLNLAPDFRALGVGMAAGLITALLAGVVPAVKATRSGMAGALRESRVRRSGLRDVFVCAQVACAMSVLVAAGVLWTTLHQAGDAPLGYDPRGVLLASPNGRLDGGKTRLLLDEIRARSSGAALASDALPTTFRRSLDARAETGNWNPMGFDWVSDGYFELLRIPVVGGRGFVPGDDTHSRPVVVVNRAAAELLWPGQNPVGRRLRIRQEPVDREVVGLTDDVRFHPLGQAEPATPCLFLPVFQRAGAAGVVIHVRAPGDPLAFVGTLRQIVASVAPDASLMDVHTLEDQVNTGLKPMQVAGQATAAVSVLGIALALAGIFASAAYRVAQQKKEIAIRIAIGAEPRRVVRGFAMRGLWIGVAGAGVGLPAALAGVTLLRSSVIGVGAAGPWLLGGSAAALSLAAFAAAMAAARRIARVQPADVLRVQ